MSDGPASPILQAMLDRGAATAEYHGVRLVRHGPGSALALLLSIRN